MGKLYIVATPIGNLEDITLRALRILKEADLILCEDTRVTRKLLEHYSIGTQTLSYHQHSGKIKSDIILNNLSQNKSIALVTDAGTPGVSDPGGKLVAEVLAAGHQLESIPGPSALTAAISISGLPMDKFLFFGFLPHKKGRQTLLKQIATSEYPVVLYESVHRIEKLIGELGAASLGARQIVIGKELTKKFETVYRGNLEEIKKQLSRDQVKGEFVVIIESVNS